MGEARLYVVFGTGQAGSARAAQPAGLGVAVRVVSLLMVVENLRGRAGQSRPARETEEGS